MSLVVTKKQLESLKFGSVSLEYLEEQFGFTPAYNSITYCEVNKKGPGTLPSELDNVIPVIIGDPNGTFRIEKQYTDSESSWKYCSQTNEIFYGEGNISPKVEEQELDQYEDYGDDYEGLARTTKIQRSKIRPW